MGREAGSLEILKTFFHANNKNNMPTTKAKTIETFTKIVRRISHVVLKKRVPKDVSQLSCIWRVGALIL